MKKIDYCFNCDHICLDDYICFYCSDCDYYIYACDYCIEYFDDLLNNLTCKTCNGNLNEKYKKCEK